MFPGALRPASARPHETPLRPRRRRASITPGPASRRIGPRLGCECTNTRPRSTVIPVSITIRPIAAGIPVVGISVIANTIVGRRTDRSGGADCGRTRDAGTMKPAACMPTGDAGHARRGGRPADPRLGALDRQRNPAFSRPAKGKPGRAPEGGTCEDELCHMCHESLRFRDQPRHKLFAMRTRAQPPAKKLIEPRRLPLWRKSGSNFRYDANDRYLRRTAGRQMDRLAVELEDPQAWPPLESCRRSSQRALGLPRCGTLICCLIWVL
jgi:hypothetical protein